MLPNLPGDEDRWFWPRVDKSGDCWLWTGGVNKTGYGQVRVSGKQTGAHRVALGIPDGDVLHRCGTRRCCRPSHLYVGDDKQNAADRARHGHTAHQTGELNGMAKLTKRAVLAIRRGGDPKKLAAKYGVRIEHIYRIRRGDRWKEVR